ncbi:hypothetical protein XH83_29045 [Bradyrhizobium sp. CCBAU 53351]|uniref:Imm42 family immunity protein n=1 Tax=Bradyrhizobium sp. CCBAU 53351 TaxID=1325114 RepID=UPI0018881B7F|nr:Imm42 family immunity protein [Bradyrhizobium sp. CCBAU 53351]QOZ79091.1 hypothetical protein XH83_29045 [Bradyrhizobium sp. CCBAU 53351]
MSNLVAQFEISETIDQWVYGNFVLVVDGLTVGNQADRSVDLKGCLSWWRDFVDHPRDRYEPGLFDASKETIFLLLASSVLEAERQPGMLLGEYYRNTFSRFHISHLGMSSFDNVTMLFVKNERGQERLVWRMGSGDIADAYLGEGEVERVFAEAAATLEQTIGRLT